MDFVRKNVRWVVLGCGAGLVATAFGDLLSMRDHIALAIGLVLIVVAGGGFRLDRSLGEDAEAAGQA